MKEVKDAYLSYKKGLSQTTIAIDKIKYKEEELKIAKARAELNDIAISELIQAYVGLTDEKSYYIDALASLYQSLAKLNKAAGYSLFLDDENFKLANVNR
jgi:outer membrane protein TolC